MVRTIQKQKDGLDSHLDVLFQEIINDLRTDINKSDAGWRLPTLLDISPEKINRILKMGYLELNDEGKIRIKFKTKNVRDELSRFETKFKQIDYFSNSQNVIKQDERRVERIEPFLTDIEKTIQNNPDILPSMIAVGLWKMFNTTEISVCIDRILKEGMSPRDWGFNSIRSTQYLAIDLTCKVSQIGTLNKAFEKLANVGLINEYSDQPGLDKEEVTKIKNILNWGQIKKILSIEDIQILGISWFIIFLLEYNSLVPLYSDFSIKVLNKVKNITEKLFGINWQEAFNNLKKSIDSFESSNEIDLSNMIVLPEVI